MLDVLFSKTVFSKQIRNLYTSVSSKCLHPRNSKIQITMPTKKPGSLKTSTDYDDNMTSADRHKIPARGGKSGKLSDGARARPCWPPFLQRLSQ